MICVLTTVPTNCYFASQRSCIKSNVFIKPFLHQLRSQSALQKPSLKPQTASNAGVEARTHRFHLWAAERSRQPEHVYPDRKPFWQWVRLASRKTLLFLTTALDCLRCLMKIFIVMLPYRSESCWKKELANVCNDNEKIITICYCLYVSLLFDMRA
jgi:hypothetical protein